MSSLLQQIKSIAQKFKSTKVSYERHKISPKKDWMILLTVTLIVLCIMAGISFYIYTQIDQGRFFTIVSDNITNKIKINTVLLNKTVDDINLRQTNLKKVTENKPNTADPSQ